ncbi:MULTISPECIES: hypothetical protein [Acidithiobacillus]|uniref:Uncharacterized protein n=2 Tax=Acidithiobacillus TaxID=119977 RepID=A0A179BQN3_ACIFR|nr:MULTISPECIES: hypothetical protein [Acidithiobacillus]MEB8488178.1 hypothetical protein [Acidithiobacillus ferriphilus]MEB8488764.1 hypothetical protein [Acidithiobacillus ferriphilus]MEB8492208.1 hypothetical protein [Acidithiobacillus ferriphilus]MEB8513511.1 hypothetical protein [Acidithiobacillus ferriphilus]MEB8520691.1 hypothetical protein [Acidithiobacillus ferriphilus]
MSKLSSTVKIGALCLSLMGLSAVTVEAVNLHYFCNKLLIKKGNKYTVSGIIGGEMHVDGGFFTSTTNGKQLIAVAIPKRNGYLVKALYRQNGKNSQFFDQMVTTNAWSHAQNGVMAKVYSYDWSQCFWQSAQDFTYQLRAEI